MKSRSGHPVQRARAAAQLTELLGEFVGHHEIAVELNEDGSTFRLVRGGKKLIEPSEGEHNALGLMYFLMRLEDDSFKPAGAIVVFDDPITSFDDQRMIDAITKILYRTGSIRGSDRRVGQIFFLTHHLGLLDRLWRELKQHRNRCRILRDAVIKGIYRSRSTNDCCKSQDSDSLSVPYCI